MKKAYFYLFFLLCIVLVLILGLKGYFYFTDVPIKSRGDIKYHSENMLFIAILFSLILMTSLILLRVKSRNILKELDKVIELSRFGTFYFEEYLDKMGQLGDRIKHLHYDLNMLNEKKSLKISSLSKLNDFLVENIDLALSITDPQGKIINVSKKLITKYKIEKKDIHDQFMNNIILNLNTENIASQLETTKNFLVNKKMKLKIKDISFDSDVVFYPIFNAKNQLAHIVFILGGEDIIEALTKKAEQITAKKPSFGKKMVDIFRRLTKPVKEKQ